MCMQKIGPAQDNNLKAFDTNVLYTPFTNWMPVAGFQSIQVLLYLLGKSGNFNVAVAYQLCSTDTTEPDGAWTVIDSYDTGIGTSGFFDTIGDKAASGIVSLVAASQYKFWVRFGFAVKNSAGTTISTGQAQAMVIGFSG